MDQIIYIEKIIQENVPEASWQWLENEGRCIREKNNLAELNKAFAQIPKKMGHHLIVNGTEIPNKIELRPTLEPKDWTTERLSRVWLLTQVKTLEKAQYLNAINSLFEVADLNELVALYSALPILAYPEEWKLKCADGIRSNMGPVLEAIMYENAYPSLFLDEPAWNQMVLKAFFTEKIVDRIRGLDQRANASLANVLFDYAHERWAAHRIVNPQLWRLTGKFIDATNFVDIQRLFQEGDETDKKAALLACYQSSFPAAKLLLDRLGEVKHSIEEKKLTWNNFHEVQFN